jgi:hypothetical protein
MNLTQPYRDARGRLGLTADDDASCVKRAYRKAVALAPPDRDPEGFRRIREAYELLVDPFPRAKERLVSPVPLVPAPSLPPSAMLPSPTALATELLRSVLGALPRADLEAPVLARSASNRPRSAVSQPTQKRESQKP